MTFRFKRTKSDKPPKPKRKRGEFRSKFEARFRDTVLATTGVLLTYEDTVLPFITAPQKRRYTPDWTIKPGWHLETKGRFDAGNRQKVLYIKQQHPNTRILIVFQNSRDFINKGSKTRYSDWCVKHNIEWCDIKDEEIWKAFIKEATLQEN
jgi:hypothetical protein